jgi:threonine/homoserine/homoserine lactone efflux protein
VRLRRPSGHDRLRVVNRPDRRPAGGPRGERNGPRRRRRRPRLFLGSHRGLIVIAELAAFLAVAVLVIVTPGQDTALTIRNSLLGGRRAGVLTAVGVSAGQARRAPTTAHGARTQTPRTALRQGLVSNLGNPKMAVFFTSLLPQFAPGGDASFVTMLLLGLLFCSLTLAWLSAYAAAVAKAGDLLRRPRVRRVLDGVTGAVLVAFGLRLATEQR